MVLEDGFLPSSAGAAAGTGGAAACRAGIGCGFFFWEALHD